MRMSMATGMRVLGFALALIAIAATQRAHASHWQGEVDVEIVSEGGERFPTYPLAHRSDPSILRAYLEAHDQARYRIQVHNRGGGRVGLVIAVDGRNIISGERSELSRTESMYILDPWQSATYEGWRTSKDQVNEFYFTDWKDSYAEAFGDRSARGVIAVAVYRERIQAQSFENRRSPKGPRVAQPSAPAPATVGGADEGLARSEPGSDFEPGTGFGEEIYSPVQRVAFDSERAPALKYFIKYEWRASLCRKRVIECDPRERNRFWDEDERLGFAPYPQGR